MTGATLPTPAFVEVSIPVPWGHVSGKWWGEIARQPVIALHGWQDNAGTFDGIGPLLPSDISMLALDLPGHGKSSHYPPGQAYYLWWDGVTVLRRIVKYYKWTKIQILGHSMGGAVGFMYAASFPSDVDKLICLDIASPAIRSTKTVANLTGPTIDRLLKYETLTKEQMPCNTKEDMLDIVVDAFNGGVTRKSAEILMIRGMTPASPGNNVSKKEGYLFSRDVRLKAAGLGLLSLDLVLEYAGRIKCEYMNIRFDPGYPFEHPEQYTRVLDKIKTTASRYDFIEIKGSHHVHLNKPEKIAPLVIDFIQTYKPDQTSSSPVMNGSSTERFHENIRPEPCFVSSCSSDSL